MRAAARGRRAHRAEGGGARLPRPGFRIPWRAPIETGLLLGPGGEFAFVGIAGEYGEAALKELARLSTEAENETARIAAIRELLRRAYGNGNSVPISIDLSRHIHGTGRGRNHRRNSEGGRCRRHWA